MIRVGPDRYTRRWWLGFAAWDFYLAGGDRWWPGKLYFLGMAAFLAWPPKADA